MDNLVFQTFSEFNHNDPFFDSLKSDYAEFPQWLEKKKLEGESAYVLYGDDHLIEGFMYLKENDDGGGIQPALADVKHLKIGTFKFESKKTLRGQRFLKKAFDRAISSGADDIYVTAFEEHAHLIKLFERYGFCRHGEKITPNGKEIVYVRTFKTIKNDVLLDYPLIIESHVKKYLLAIYPEFHTRLFPDSKLITDSPDIVQDVSHTNSIHKIYISGMPSVMRMQRGDLIIIYRTGDKKGKAFYRAVASSICVVESVKEMKNFADENDFVNECGKLSIFGEEELRNIYQTKKRRYIIRFTYNLALPKRPTRGSLIQDAGLNGTTGYRWNHFILTDEQFNKIIKLGRVDESFIINQA